MVRKCTLPHVIIHFSIGFHCIMQYECEKLFLCQSGEAPFHVVMRSLGVCVCFYEDNKPCFTALHKAYWLQLCVVTQ